MTVVPLEAIVLFPGTPPSRITPVAGSGPPFAILGVPSPPPELATCHADHAALRVICTAVAEPKARVRRCAVVLRHLVALGGCAVVLPAAQKLLDASALAGADAPLGPDEFERVFLHYHAVSDGERLWYHTHGMEQLGLPDVECRGPVTDAERIRRLVGGVVRHLVADRPALRIGDYLEAVGEGAVVRLDRATPAAEHRYGAFGAIELVRDLIDVAVADGTR